MKNSEFINSWEDKHIIIKPCSQQRPAYAYISKQTYGIFEWVRRPCWEYFGNYWTMQAIMLGISTPPHLLAYLTQVIVHLIGQSVESLNKQFIQYILSSKSMWEH